MRMALVSSNGDIVNIIEADAGFDPGSGLKAVPADGPVSTGWIWKDGGFISPDLKQEAPAAVSDLQFRLALNASGLRDQAELVISAGSQGLRDYWDRAIEIHRDHPFVVEAARALGKSGQEVDELFRLAAQL